MKNQTVLVATASLFLFASTVSYAGRLASENELQQAIVKNMEQRQAADTQKLEHVAALAGEKRGDLSAKNEEVTNAYNQWMELKSAAEKSRSDDAKFKAIEAGQRYSQVNNEFVHMQKDILVNMSDSVTVAEAINALNDTAPSAAGR